MTPWTSARRERLGEQRVGLGEQVVDVGAGGDRPAGAVRPRRVGVADQPAALPRDDEQDALLGPREHAGLHRDAVARRRRRGCPSTARCAGPSGRRRARAAGRSTRPTAQATCRARSEQRLAALLVDRLDLAGRRREARSPARGWRCARRGPRRCARRRRPCARRPPSASWNCTAPTSASGRSAGRLGQRAAPAQVAVPRHRARAADRVVEQRARRRGTPAPSRGRAAATGTARARRGAARSASAAARARAAPRARARCRPSPGSAARRG